MRKRLWLLLCLIALECAFTTADWKDSLQLAKIHQAALQLHGQSLRGDEAERSLQRSAAAADPQIIAAQQLEDKGWALIDHGQTVRRGKFIWQTLALGVLLAILAIGLWSFVVSQREVRRRGKAEAELRAEQASLEQRIETRTAELRAEVEERRRAEEQNRRQKRVLELLANDAPLKEVFKELTASVAVQRRSWESAIHLVDAGNHSLQLVASSQVSEWLEHYLDAIAVGFPDAPEGRAWASGEPWLAASLSDEHRPWSELLVSNGIRSAWSLPLRLSDGEVRGTLTVYSRLFGLPDERDRELLDAAVRLAALVLDVRRMHRELVSKAYEDELTGVANRRAGEIRLEEAMAGARQRGNSFAVLWIDLDRFKRVNDVYGHAHGDQVLLEVARRISTHSRVQGAVARMGGDEFLVLLESCSGEEHAHVTAMELASAIAEPIQLGSETASVGASIGITLFPRDGETPDELERHADAAMYQAKRRNIGWCAFSPAIRDEVTRHIRIEEGLREALQMEPEQNPLEVHYQPILSLSGKLLEFEALLRFRHPELGSISPAQFISIAEETKLIIPVGRWVLRQVCEQIVAWEQAGFPPVRVGVNISAVQWGREDFVDEVREVIGASAVTPSALTFEMTESVVMQNAQRVSAHIRELKGMGVRVAMDDFGTGYSSLSNLHQLPLDVLKIDRSFIARLGQADDSRTIVESVISMAHLLGMIAIAEGVETEAQRRMLTEMRCDAVQGFLFARPMPGVDVAEFIHNLSAKRAGGEVRLPVLCGAGAPAAVGALRA